MATGEVRTISSMYRGIIPALPSVFSLFQTNTLVHVPQLVQKDWFCICGQASEEYSAPLEWQQLLVLKRGFILKYHLYLKAKLEQLYKYLKSWEKEQQLKTCRTQPLNQTEVDFPTLFIKGLFKDARIKWPLFSHSSHKSFRNSPKFIQGTVFTLMGKQIKQRKSQKMFAQELLGLKCPGFCNCSKTGAMTRAGSREDLQCCWCPCVPGLCGSCC